MLSAFDVYSCCVLIFAFMDNKTFNKEYKNVWLYDLCHDALNVNLSLTSELFSFCVPS